MIPDGYQPGQVCPVCKRTFYREVGPDYTIEGCSQFCDEATDEDKVALFGLQPGEYGLWPCAACGCTMEGEYDPQGTCSDCYHKARIESRNQLLREALPHLPQELAEKVRAELEKPL